VAQEAGAGQIQMSLPWHKALCHTAQVGVIVSLLCLKN